jgi:hypothetical protein
MELIGINFYRLEDVAAADGVTPDHRKFQGRPPLASFKAKTRTIFRMHLEHLGFELSRNRPDLEGHSLPASLEFRGDAGRPGLPWLRVSHSGKPVGEIPIRMQSLDLSSLAVLICRKNPQLENVALAFTLHPVGAEIREMP